MHKNNIITLLVVGILSILPAALKAQTSSINTYSPYTFYGVGDIYNQGPINLRGMGGVGIAFRDPTSINFLNPASYSTIPRQSFLFNFGGEGQNFYLKSKDPFDNSTKKSSFNTFNVNDVSIQFPLAAKVGFALSVSPFTNVGYRAQMEETDVNIIGNIGDVKYIYEGEGGISQLKAGVGWEVFRNISIGAEMIYLHGSIDRTYVADFTVITGEGSFYNTNATQYEEYSRIFGNFGFQANLISNSRRLLTVGGTYQIGGKLNPSISRYVTAQDDGMELILENDIHSDMKMPSIIAAGVFFQTPKISVGLDYYNHNWGDSNKNYMTGNSTKTVTMRNTNTYKVGFQFVPNRFDVRKYLNRISFRLGARYSDYYLRFNDHGIKDKAITFGLGFPINFMGMSNIDFGMEFGQRGTMRHELIKENYFKFSLGLRLFGEDYWFQKMKIN